jgi:GT2 family glycosyltransferase
MLVSIVIPTYNNWELTKDCLDSIKNKTEVNHEIIVVDNNSTDETVERLKRASEIKLITNTCNLGFAKASNQGVKIARGSLILFLNNDTIATRNCLSKMVEMMKVEEKAGVVGNKLLFPETNLIQHAGVVLNNGKPAHIHYQEPASLPEANVRKEYPAVTGACLLTLRDLFLKMGGFDEKFVNGYEDVDLCLRVREAGFRVLYCPDSVVYHYGSVTEGRHSCEQENLDYFLNKWQSY